MICSEGATKKVIGNNKKNMKTFNMSPYKNFIYLCCSPSDRTKKRILNNFLRRTKYESICFAAKNAGDIKSLVLLCCRCL
jgi:uncharacterized protein YegL